MHGFELFTVADWRTSEYMDINCLSSSKRGFYQVYQRQNPALLSSVSKVRIKTKTEKIVPNEKS